MTTMSRRGVLQSAGGAGVAAIAGGSSPRAFAAVGGTPSSEREPVFTFVSMPDFLNGDVADLSVLPSWDRGPNSVNDSWRLAMDRCLGFVSDHRPDAVFLAGDLVEGHWNIDSDDRQLFGPVRPGIDLESLAMCSSAIRTAGDVHYSFAADLFSSRGLTLYPAIGDHEILDDRAGPLNQRWNPGGWTHGKPDNRYYLVPQAKQVWADHFTVPDGVPRYSRRPIGSASEWTAYAVSFADHVTLITVDMFTRRRAGVQLGVFGGQLDWLRREIRKAKRRGHVVIVQGHIPVMTPTRWIASGRLRVPEGRSSAFYRVLDREGADLFLCGEVHDSTVIQRGRHAPVQISHGCIFRLAFSFLVGRVYAGGKVRLDLFEVPITEASVEEGLWCSDANKWQRTHIEYGDPVHRGKLVMRDHSISKRTAKLGKYDPVADPYALVGNLGTTMV
jgi:3',5'-cyclic AMP phosphodiesterase CpdA